MSQENENKIDTPNTESMDLYKNELDSSFRKITEGDIVKGTVVNISDTEVMLDLNSYAEGIIKAGNMSNDPDFSIRESVSMGDVISAVVIRTDDGEGNVELSKKDADSILAWDKLKQLMADGTILNVKIQGIVNAGVITYVEGIRGFIPASKLSLSYVDKDNLDEWLFKTIDVKIITVDENDKKLVLSAKEILKEKEEDETKKKAANLAVGFVTTGVVESLQTYGAFIKLENGLSGLVHISQISEKRIKTPAAVLSVGETVKVKIIGVKDGKISLSMKALAETPASDIEEATFELPKSEEVTTSLGSLFKNLKF